MEEKEVGHMVGDDPLVPGLVQGRIDRFAEGAGLDRYCVDAARLFLIRMAFLMPRDGDLPPWAEVHFARPLASGRLGDDDFARQDVLAQEGFQGPRQIAAVILHRDDGGHGGLHPLVF